MVVKRNWHLSTWFEILFQDLLKDSWGSIEARRAAGRLIRRFWSAIIRYMIIQRWKRNRIITFAWIVPIVRIMHHIMQVIFQTAHIIQCTRSHGSSAAAASANSAEVPTSVLLEQKKTHQSIHSSYYRLPSTCLINLNSFIIDCMRHVSIFSCARTANESLTLDDECNFIYYQPNG